MKESLELCLRASVETEERGEGDRAEVTVTMHKPDVEKSCSSSMDYKQR